MKDLEIKQELREDVDCIVRDYLEKVLAGDKKAVKSFVHLMFLSYAKAKERCPGDGVLHEAWRRALAERSVLHVLKLEAQKILESEKQEINKNGNGKQ